jgi:hypothetical protein
MGGERVDIFGIERRDERGVQAGVDLMNYGVSLFLDGFNLMRGARQVGIPRRGALHQQVRGLANEFYLLMEVFEELLFSWQKVHVVLYLANPLDVGSTSVLLTGKESRKCVSSSGSKE